MISKPTSLSLVVFTTLSVFPECCSMKDIKALNKMAGKNKRNRSSGQNKLRFVPTGWLVRIFLLLESSLMVFPTQLKLNQTPQSMFQCPMTVCESCSPTSIKHSHSGLASISLNDTASMNETLNQNPPPPKVQSIKNIPTIHAHVRS